MQDTTIVGKIITLRPATLDDRRVIYEWLAESDITGTMSGPPLFTEKATSTACSW